LLRCILANASARAQRATKIERILEQIAEKGDKRWLTRQLANADEPPLNQRMFESLKDLPLSLKDAALRKFCDVCAAKRHDISHFGGQRQRVITAISS
jgi:hypothetical protein